MISTNVASLSFVPSKRVYAICLVECQNLQNFQGLKQVPVVSLDRCFQVKDIAGALGENQEVTLQSCHKLTSVTSLSSVPTVYIYDCTAVAKKNLL
jgi:hypothetical protein